MTMTTTKAAILNDSHFGKSNNSEEIFLHQKSFFDGVFFPFLKQNEITHIFHLGDLLDNRKAISPKTLYNMRKVFLEPLRENGIHMTIIPGNHDLFYKNTDEISGLKETLGYFTDIVTIIQNPTMIDYNGTKVGWVPWINDQNRQKVNEFIKTTDATVLLGHFEFHGFYMDQHTKARTGMAWNDGTFDRFEMVLTGHYHHKSQKQNIHYLGCQYEMTWADLNDKKYFHVLEMDLGEKPRLVQVRNKNTLFKEVKYKTDEMVNMEHRREDYENKYVRVICYDKNDPYLFDRFIKTIESYNPHGVAINDLSILIEDEQQKSLDGTIMDLDDLSWKDTMVFASRYIDEKVLMDNSHLDKNMLHSVFEELYREAEVIE